MTRLGLLTTFYRSRARGNGSWSTLRHPHRPPLSDRDTQHREDRAWRAAAEAYIVAKSRAEVSAAGLDDAKSAPDSARRPRERVRRRGEGEPVLESGDDRLQEDPAAEGRRPRAVPAANRRRKCGSRWVKGLGPMRFGASGLYPPGDMGPQNLSAGGTNAVVSLHMRAILNAR